MASSPSRIGGELEKKTITVDMSLSSPSRTIKRPVDDAALYPDDLVEIAEKLKCPEWMTANGLTSDSETHDVRVFAPTSLWAARAQTAWDLYGIYDAPEEEAAKVGTPVEGVEATEHGLSSSTTKNDFYNEISHIISRLIEGNITRVELIERLQGMASQLKQEV